MKCRARPAICKVAPSGKYHMEDVDRAGGISAIPPHARREAGHAESILYDRHRSHAGGQHLRCVVKDADVIRPLTNVYSEKGGLAVLYGNLAPNGSVIKTGGVQPR